MRLASALVEMPGQGRVGPRMGGCENDGPFLGTLNIGRIIIGIQKGP